VTETPNPNIVDTDTLTGEMHPIRRCVLAIGSNLGERLNNLQGAVNALIDTPEVWVTAVSPVYETEPIGATEGSKDFLNAVVLADPWPSRTPTTASAPGSTAPRAPSTST
jgi:2-amino-4-hydroxy-6-hydroxymethyldihydropteridine diphosphokinase